jgi:hypothetical protein
MTEYTFYIAINKSLTEHYGNKGTPVKVGYSKWWPYRVRALNGNVKKDEGKYGAMKSGKYVLEENWWIPEGCFLKCRTNDPKSIEKKIEAEILSRGGSKIEGHTTKRESKDEASEELYIIPTETKFTKVMKGKPLWKSGVALFGGRMTGIEDDYEMIEISIPIETIAQEIIKSILID